MKWILEKASGLLAFVCAIVFMIYGTLVYFVRHQDPITGIIRDGLGREMVLPPFFVRRILNWAELWPGIWAFLLDMVILFGLVGLTFLFGYLASVTTQSK